ncbi:MAG: isoleucine--tRNA ligase [Bacteroidales bacterium]|nr:isoleucine--tRNA ligase [Bacteroidales bacterium]HOY38153.1 isoleucine--tRNA ligase [Bacteroidales bacterium]HQP03051.1 isoleucine--tRNA ligase [Bacteroidales bacterium]
MSKKFPEYKALDLPQINRDINELWDKENTFAKSITTRQNCKEFIFFEGPPSANGKPGIHHVMARTIKDIFCRYKTLDGYKVKRKAGWDTHGLPVELSVEKTLGITKEDIGKKISVEDYNKTCRTEVMKYTREWEELTREIGYWVDMDNPYITYDNRYIETLWYLLKKLYEKGYLYKGYTIQPYSPAAGTGLSTHELNQPGCYRDVKDTTCVSMFQVIRNEKSSFLFHTPDDEISILAWTTTPWTLPSNTALAVGESIEYSLVETFNPYTGNRIKVVLCSDRISAYFKPEGLQLDFSTFKQGDKVIPYRINNTFPGSQLIGIAYRQLIDWVKPMTNAFRVISGDYVTTDDGTGIVHIAPTFGADDLRVAKAAGIPALLIEDKDRNLQALVDKQGKFFRIEEMHPDFLKEYVNTASYSTFAGRYVKNEYDDNANETTVSADIEISVMLKQNNKAFRIEKHIHNYPHCWRTDKPILYYPLDSWFIRTTAFKDRLIELNKTINWKPASTGEGRFGKWLENLVDWNLSRSRFWGTPLPIWASSDGSERICIGSVEELCTGIKASIQAGYMKENPFEGFIPGIFSDENYARIDLHRPFVDKVVLVSESGKPMYREPDLIDVWFDSGAMPYAQWHYPFENSERFNELFPADFIAEGVDQTRGWFFTLHAISTMISDSVSFKNIISNGLVLDKFGNKMSKRLGNAVDPFEVIEQHGADALRWYMITNAQPWDNLKFDVEKDPETGKNIYAGIDEVKRKFFGTYYNTYSFFALYANVDKYTASEKEIPVSERSELDRWIISLLNSLIIEVREHYENYEPTRAGRAIQTFVADHLSNWYVRLGRKRYWGGDFSEDKISAYQTLYHCLITISKLASPIAPFITDRVYRDLNQTTGKESADSVHLCSFPVADANCIDKYLEERMQMAQDISSMILSLRRRVNIKVRQPLQQIMVPVLTDSFAEQLRLVESIILTETNIKEIKYLTDASNLLIKKIKPNFKTLGPKFGKLLKPISEIIQSFSQEDINRFEKDGFINIQHEGKEIRIERADVEILSEDIQGWLVANEGTLTVALDITVTPQLKQEGIARELVNRIQNLRKDSGFEVTDKINIFVQHHSELSDSVINFNDYICAQTLAHSINILNKMEHNSSKIVEIDNFETLIRVERIGK